MVKIFQVTVTLQHHIKLSTLYVCNSTEASIITQQKFKFFIYYTDNASFAEALHKQDFTNDKSVKHSFSVAKKKGSKIVAISIIQ